MRRIQKTVILLLNRVRPAWTGLLFPLFLMQISGLFALEEQSSPGEQAEHLGLPNWAGEDYAPVVTPNGQFLIFLSDRPGDHDGANYWYTANANYTDPSGPPRWNVPLSLVLPMEGDGSPTMQVTGGRGHTSRPPGGFSLNTDGYEGPLSIRYDSSGRPVEIFFTSRTENTKRDGYDGLNIYTSRYLDERWTTPEHLNTINSHFNDRMPAISTDGKRLFFSSDRPGGIGGYDLWESHRENVRDSWSEPVNMGSLFNTRYDENAPVLSLRETMLFFSSNRPGGMGHFDLYVSRFDSFFWSEPENLGSPFNSKWDDEFISFTGDGMWAYFSSDRRGLLAQGGFDLYRHRVPPWLIEGVEVLLTGLILDGRTREPLGVEATIEVTYEKNTIVGTSRIFQKDPGREITSNYAIELISGRNYRVVFSAPGFYPVELNLDYRGAIPPGNVDRRNIVMQPLRPEQTEEAGETRLIQGRVIDAKTRLSLPGSNVSYMIEGGRYRDVAVDRNGNFHIRVQKGKPFAVYARAPDYTPLRREFVERSDLKQIVMALHKEDTRVVCPSENPQCVDNIRVYFDTDSTRIEQSEDPSLEAIARIMKANPELKIEIQGHTDRQYSGPKSRAYEYNLQLSRKRAQAVQKKLMQLGITKDRLVIKGYSYLKPRVEESPSANTRLNRRVEFRRMETGS